MEERGKISGTPTSVSARQLYTVTFTGNGDYTGTATFDIYLDVIAATYKVGDPGPAGGNIFYVNPNASTDGWTYLEAASQHLKEEEVNPVDNSIEEVVHWHWGIKGTKVGTEKAIGKGKTNTEKIVAELTGSQSIDITTYGAGKCSEYVSGHYDDWFLPSEDELTELVTYLAPNFLNGNQ